MERGPAPVYFGFGSMPDPEPARLEQIVLEVLERLDLRAVALIGGSGSFRHRRSKRLFPVESADFAWLLPRMAAAVHHGAAGTMACCLRAGLSQVIVPHGLDQPFWGRHMENLGLAPSAIPRSQLSAPRLSDALRAALNNPVMRANARAMSRRLEAEDGVSCAVAILERHWAPQAGVAA